jgi:hypothetical protein
MTPQHHYCDGQLSVQHVLVNISQPLAEKHAILCCGILVSVAAAA